MADFVNFFGLFGHKIHILRYIKLKQANNMYIDTTKRINLAKKSQQIPIIPYKGICFLAIAQPFFD